MSDKTHVNLRVLTNNLKDLLAERDYLAAELARAQRRIEQYEKIQDSVVPVHSQNLLHVDFPRSRDPDYMRHARERTDIGIARRLGEELYRHGKQQTFPQPCDVEFEHVEERRVTILVLPPDTEWPHRGEH